MSRKIAPHDHVLECARLSFQIIGMSRPEYIDLYAMSVLADVQDLKTALDGAQQDTSYLTALYGDSAYCLGDVYGTSAHEASVALSQKILFYLTFVATLAKPVDDFAAGQLAKSVLSVIYRRFHSLDETEWSRLKATLDIERARAELAAKSAVRKRCTHPSTAKKIAATKRFIELRAELGGKDAAKAVCNEIGKYKLSTLTTYAARAAKNNSRIK